MRVNAERLTWADKDSVTVRWRAAEAGLYQRTVPNFWKLCTRNTSSRAGGILQFRERSPPAVGNLGILQMLGREADRAALRGEAYGAEGDGYPCREPAS